MKKLLTFALLCLLTFSCAPKKAASVPVEDITEVADSLAVVDSLQ